MRLRVRCGSAYQLGDLQWCMVHVPEHLHTVRDLALHISKLLELDRHHNGPAGAQPPQVLLEGFLIPHDEEVQAVLRDDEVVDIEPSEPSAQGLLPLASQAAWGSPAAAATGKRPLETPDSLAGEKRPRRGGKGAAAAPAAMAALGWQSPQASSMASPAAASAAKPAPAAAAEESSEDDSSDDEPAGGVAVSAAAKAKVLAAKAKALAAVASEAARKASLATCSAGATAASASTEGSPQDGNGIFVGGLAPSVNDDELRKYFEQYGQVSSASVVINNSTGKSKGYAFVEFANGAGRAKAIGAGPKLQMADRTIEVKPRIAKGAGGAGKGKDSKGKDAKGKGKDAKGDGKNSVNGKGKGAAAVEESSSDEDSSDDEAPKKVAAPKAASAPEAGAAASAPAKPVKKTAEAALEISSDELEVQRQMAALGLPVSFTANAGLPGGESDDDEEEEEEDGEA